MEFEVNRSVQSRSELSEVYNPFIKKNDNLVWSTVKGKVLMVKMKDGFWTLLLNRQEAWKNQFHSTIHILDKAFVLI